VAYYENREDGFATKRERGMYRLQDRDLKATVKSSTQQDYKVKLL
jgi:hypothetical protein